MELSKSQTKMTKGIAILFMVLLHLFCTKTYKGIFTPLVIIRGVPLIYYFALFGDCAVAIYCFCSGYGLFIIYENNKNNYVRSNLKRIVKLYIKFWIVLFMFVVILGFITGKQDVYPGSLLKFISSALGINNSYNGEWWFLEIYIILVVLSPLMNKVVEKNNWIIVSLVSMIIYVIMYFQRVWGIISFNNEVLEWIIKQVALFGTSQFPFIIGTVFAKNRLYSKLCCYIGKVKFKNTICIGLVILMIIGHAIVQSLFVAVFTGIVFLCIFNFMDKKIWIDKFFLFMGDNSTNIWLIHMFFYSTYFRRLVFYPKYPILIYMWLIILCLPVSILFNAIYIKIIKYIFAEKKQLNNVNI